MRRFIPCILSCLLGFTLQLSAQQDILKFDKTVHDFGQVLLGSGPISCSFTATNVSSTSQSIQSVSTSCGCTAVKWDHKEIAPGGKTVITATYTNDEGAYPFDKTLTVTLTSGRRPVVLHLRGVCRKEFKPDEEVYTFSLGGGLGLMEGSLKAVNVEQGSSKGEQVTVANMSSKALKLGFADVSEGLSLELVPNPVPAHSHATLYYTIAAREGLWGKNWYYATPVVDGKKNAEGRISVSAFTSISFSNMTREEKAGAARPVFAESTLSFGHKKAGAIIKGSFVCENKGASTLKVYKVDCDTPGLKCGTFPELAPGAKASFPITFDTSSLPKGEALIILSLTTNSPLRPIVTLFLAGWID